MQYRKIYLGAIRKAVFWLFVMLMLMVIMTPSAASVLYNTTNITNANNLYEQAKALNDIVDGEIGYGIILIVFVITFVMLAGTYGPLEGFGGASFIAVLSATLFLPLGLISFGIYEIILLAGGVSVFLSLILVRR